MTGVDWLEIHEGGSPLIVSFPHTGVVIPPEIEARLLTPWLGRKDTDWWIDRLYDFAGDLGATTIRTRMSRTVIDVNRDPSGASLYPSAASTGLCPIETFDGEPLYLAGQAPGAAQVEARRETWFEPYHTALASQISRLRADHPNVVLYDAHAIRSRIPRLFDGVLPQCNIGTNSGASCDPALAEAIQAICAADGWSHVVNGRFRGGWTTRHYGRPGEGVHAIQMELACRAYLAEPPIATPDTWPAPYDEGAAGPFRDTLKRILQACLDFAATTNNSRDRP